MTLKVYALPSAIALSCVFACGSKRIPPGTPAPEYEPPVVAPWSPPGSADAGGSDPESEPALEPDLGSVDAGASPASDAGDAGPAQQPL